jgi:hypothetical protein
MALEIVQILSKSSRCLVGWSLEQRNPEVKSPSIAPTGSGITLTLGEFPNLESACDHMVDPSTEKATTSDHGMGRARALRLP